ncbi:hypothetical protein GGI42DRAFT_66858 [Trichoderma sp. SZMC 28013]
MERQTIRDGVSIQGTVPWVPAHRRKRLPALGQSWLAVALALALASKRRPADRVAEGARGSKRVLQVHYVEVQAGSLKYEYQRRTLARFVHRSSNPSYRSTGYPCQPRDAVELHVRSNLSTGLFGQTLSAMMTASALKGSSLRIHNDYISL